MIVCFSKFCDYMRLTNSVFSNNPDLVFGDRVEFQFYSFLVFTPSCVILYYLFFSSGSLWLV